MIFGCIGKTLGHSYSPDIHKAFGKYEYQMWEMTAEELPSFLQERAFDGINITVPYKTAVLPYIDVLSDEARKIGAVNTVIKKNGKLYGYNTDFYGLTELIRKKGVTIAGQKVLICGSGGTSKTAMAVVQALGAKEVYRLSRQPSGDTIGYDTAYDKHRDAAVILNTTPAGMYPNYHDCAIEVERFSALTAAVDVIYNPLRTEFLQRAQAMGVKAVSGLYMLVAQAAAAAKLFTGSEIAPEKTEKVYADLLQQKQNIVLIGMPTCGKTTVGRLLAEQLERRFVDTDQLFTETIGQTPALFLRTHSETEFRNAESNIITSLTAHGAVIATGGGAILRKENVSALRRDGKLYFLDRPLEKLLPATDRPLSETRAALQKLLDERYQKYLSAADRRIDAAGEINSVKNSIIEDLKK